MRHALCQVLKHGDEPRDCESSCPCYCSQVEGLGLHVVYITPYVIGIKKHLRNRIEIIDIEIARNMKRYALQAKDLVQGLLQLRSKKADVTL